MIKEILKTKKNRIMAGAILALVVCAGMFIGFCIQKIGSPKLLPGQTAVADWVTHEDEHGFTVQTPKTWKVSVTDWGLIKIGPNPDKNDQQAAFALTMIYSQDKAKDEVLTDVNNYFAKAFDNFKIVEQKVVDEYGSIICHIQYTGSDMTGVLNINGSGKNYFVSGFAAPKNQLEADMPDLVKTLTSFNYDAKLKNPEKFSNLVKMVSWKDPNEGAFTINVPTGWTVSGGVVRPYIDAALNIVATSGDSGIQVDNPYSPIYVTPNQMLSFAGFPEGSRYNPSGGVSQDMIVMSENDARSYITNVFADTLGLKVDSVSLRDDIAAKVPQNSLVTQTTAAEGTLSGDGKIHKVIVVEQGLGMSSSSGTSMWSVGVTHYWAPAAEIFKIEEIAIAMGESFVVDRTWAKNEQVEIAKRSQIISQNQAEISDIISSTFEYRSASQDKMMEKWDDAILGVQDVYDPTTGENYTVPNTSRHYWTDGFDTIVGTETSDSPGNYWDWKELVPTE